MTTVLHSEPDPPPADDEDEDYCQCDREATFTELEANECDVCGRKIA